MTDTVWVAVDQDGKEEETLTNDKAALDRAKAGSKDEMRGRYRVILSKVDLSELRAYFKSLPAHREIPEEAWNTIDVSVDGVAESGSSMYTLLYICVSFPQACHTALVWRLYRHLKSFRPDLDTVYGGIVNGIKESGLTLGRLCADGKERKLARGMKGCNSYYACDYCVAKGSRPKGSTKIKYGVRDLRQQFRTNAQLEDLAAEAKRRRDILDNWKGSQVRSEGGAATTKKAAEDELIDACKGVKERTPLLDLGPSFDVIWGLPYDAMHQIDKGEVN